ncbi:MAG: sensor histidine kinase [Oscillospiraceae bacterium]
MAVIIVLLSAAAVGLLVKIHLMKRSAPITEKPPADSGEQYINDREQLKNDVSHIAHDLRTPLTSICGYIDIMKKKNPSPDFLRYLCIMSESAEEMKQFTEELAKYAYIFSARQTEDGRSELRGIIEKALLEHYDILKKRGITPEISLPQSDVTRRADPDAAYRVISMIINCAARACSGELRLGVDENGTVSVSFLSCFPENITSERLLNKYYIFGKDSSTSGPGLYIAVRIAESMGGSIAAQRRGDRFNVMLTLP